MVKGCASYSQSFLVHGGMYVITTWHLRVRRKRKRPRRRKPSDHRWVFMSVVSVHALLA